MSATVELTKLLINQASVTPEDALCQELLAQRLKVLDFAIEHLPYGEVKNLWAKRGKAKPLFIFLGHTDVVPAGPVEKWLSPPFVASERDGYLYGRGAQDMKSNIAAMITACERFIKNHPQHQGSIGILLTSDEEGPSTNGTKQVIEEFEKRGEKIDWCVVGEPSGKVHAADVIKIGRRGSLSVKIIIHGIQGHIAYPQLADNAIHRALPAATELTNTVWDEGNEFFPATSFQISNIHAGTGAGNVIPGQLEILGNFRYSSSVTADELKLRFSRILKKYHLNFSL